MHPQRAKRQLAAISKARHDDEVQEGHKGIENVHQPFPGVQVPLEVMAKDVAAYIAWASDPRQVQRKQTGIGVLIFLFIFAGITYLSYRRIWKGVAH